MPFPLAHPAAVLPLRRYCPRPLVFAALVIGSISPDVGYLFSGSGLDELAHTLVGGTAFGVVIGMAMLWLFYFLVPIALRFVSSPYREAMSKLHHLPPAGIPALVISLAIGVWTHLFLDSVTHSHGWLVTRLPWLQSSVLVFHGRSLKVCHLLWYGCSFIGVAWLVVAGRKWQESHWPTSSAASNASHTVEAIVVSMLILPIEIVHHLVHSRFGLFLVAGTTAIAILLVISWFSVHGPDSSLQKNPSGPPGQ